MKVMKFKFLATVAGALTSILTAGSVHATIYDYSYTFFNNSDPSNPLTVSGSLDGTQNGNVVNVVGNVTVLFNGTDIGTVSTQNLLTYDPPVVSFDGLANNFIFFSNDNTYFEMLTGSSTQNEAVAVGLGFNSGDSVDINLKEWHITPVPEPSTLTAGLLLALLIGFHWALRERKQANS